MDNQAVADHDDISDGLTPRTKRLLWTIRSNVKTALMPELTSPGARDVAARIDALLAELIVREERTPHLLVTQIGEGIELLKTGLQLVDNAEMKIVVNRLPRDLSVGHSLSKLSRTRRDIADVLEAMVSLVAGRSGAAMRTFEDSAASWDRAFVEAQLAPPEAQDLPSTTTSPPVTAAALEACIAENALFPGQSSVLAVEPLAGGYSKGIFRCDVDNSELGRFPVVLRRNQTEPIDPSGCFLQANEFRMTKALFRAGVRLPKPLHFEPAGARFGGEVSIMQYTPGRLYGDVLNANADLTADMVRDLAAVLAQLHRLQLEDLSPDVDGLAPPGGLCTIARANAAMLDHHENYWLKYRVVPSPLVARSFGWLRRNVPPNEAPARVIHGDFGLNNVLFHEGRVSGVLDWETLQIGDPAYEVAYLRDPLIGRSLWQPFLDAYRAEGGQPVDEASIRFHRAARWLRNVAFTSVSAGRFDAGTWDSLPVAALAVAVRPVFMQRADDFARDPEPQEAAP